MAWSRRTIRPSPARRIFSKIDTDQRSLNSLRTYRRRPAAQTAARVRAGASLHAFEQPFSLRANGSGRIHGMDSIEAGSVTLRQLGPGDIADVTAAGNDAL